jgi:hypothetical protein
MMTYFVNYPALSNIHAHTKAVMDIFNSRMLIACYIPAVLLVVAAVALYFVAPKTISRRALLASVLLSCISVITTLVFILPIHAGFSTTGLTAAIQSKLLPLSLYFQIIPAALQVLIALVILNGYVQNVKLVGKWLFILVFALNFYTLGSNAIEAGVNYAYWGAIGDADWLHYRFSGGKFFQVFLIPAFLPFLLIIPLIWLRPRAIPRWFTVIFLLAQVFIFITTSTYFVPKIQLPLNNSFSLKLIEDLNHYDFMLRGTAGWVLNFMAGWMFLKIGQLQMKKGKPGAYNSK